MKKTIQLLLILCLVFAIHTPLSSVQGASANISVFVKGTKLTYPTNTQPYVTNGIVMVPATFTFSKVGAKVTSRTIHKKMTIKASLAKKTLELTQGSKTMRTNNTKKAISTAPIVRSGIMYIPVNVLNAGLGVKLDIANSKGGHVVRLMQPQTTPDKPKPVVTEQLVEITAQNFKFNQDEYKVKAGQPITFTFKNNQGVHGISIVGTDVSLFDGQSKVVTLDVGEYTIFCNVPCGTGHSMMRAKLVVS